MLACWHLCPVRCSSARISVGNATLTPGDAESRLQRVDPVAGSDAGPCDAMGGRCHAAGAGRVHRETIAWMMTW